MSKADELVEVTQADRVAAADVFGGLFGDNVAGCNWITEGLQDESQLVQAFARHRLSVEREALERAAKVAETAEVSASYQWGAGRPNFEKGRQAAASAIRGLQP